MVLTLLACRSIDPAPEDLDGVLHYLWENGRSGDDEVVARGIESLHAAVGDLEETEDGVLTRLSETQADLVSPRGDFDPVFAAGIYMLNTFPCDTAQLDEILIHADQDETRPDTYISYERSFTTDAAAYRAGSVETLEWEVDIAANIVLSDYTEKLQGGIRRVETEVGPAFVQITWMTEAAVFEGDGNYWNQDYQLEIYWERAPQDIVHVYGMWRELKVAGFSSDNEGVQRQVLNGLADWDEQTAVLCAEGRP